MILSPAQPVVENTPTANHQSVIVRAEENQLRVVHLHPAVLVQVGIALDALINLKLRKEIK
jgi:hypothetical protein